MTADKVKIWLGMIMAVFVICCFTMAVCENDPDVSITCTEEWSWEPGAYNTFNGEINLTELAGEELTVQMSTDLLYENETEQNNRPVFTIVNGKRITMLKQSAVTKCTPDKEDPILRFSGRLTLPQKKRVNRMVFQFTIMNAKGQEMKTVSAAFSEETDNVHGGAFYTLLNIRLITAAAGFAAAMVWAAVLARCIYRGKIKRTGEQ